MSANKSPVLAAGDTLVLKEQLADGWWRAEINGVLSRIHIPKVKSIKRQRSTEEKDKVLQRQTSHKKEGSSSSSNGGGGNSNLVSGLPPPLDASSLPPPITSDSVVNLRGSPYASTSPVLPSASNSSLALSLHQISPRNQSTLNIGSPRDDIEPLSPSHSNSGPISSSPEPSSSVPAPSECLSDGEESAERKSTKPSMRKRASKLFQEGVDKVFGTNKNSKSDGEDAPSPTLSNKGSTSDPEEEPRKKSLRPKNGGNASRDTKTMVRSPSTSTRQTRAQVKNELSDIEIGVEETRVEVGLVIKVLNTEGGIKYVESRLPQEISPEQRILEKMLEGPFTALFAHPTGQKAEENIALAPPKPVFYSELLIPPCNLNALSGEEKLSLRTLDFNVFPYKDSDDEEHVFLLLMVMFYDFDLPRIFKISDLTLYRFLLMVSRKYRSVPFHNFFHAFNVTQTLYYFLRTCQASKLLGPLEILALLIAAICHDCDHPGFNNDFQRKAQTRIYHMHKKSVLENHHYLQCMSTLANPETNILSNLSQEQEDQIYIYLRDLILATDLAVHGIILKSLTERKKILAKHFKAGSPVGMLEEDRKLIMVSLIKCADLSNEVRKGHLAKAWAKLVIEEFFAQSDKEREMGLPVTPFMDKHKIIIAKEQINFIEKLCLPLYTQLAQVFPEIENCCLQMEENKAAWLDRLRNFFVADELKKLSNKSIWEREQVKTKGTSLSSTLAMRASNSSHMPKTRRPSFSNPNSPTSESQPAPVSAIVSSAPAATPISPSPSSSDVTRSGSVVKDSKESKESTKKDLKASSSAAIKPIKK